MQKGRESILPVVLRTIWRLETPPTCNLPLQKQNKSITATRTLGDIWDIYWFCMQQQQLPKWHLLIGWKLINSRRLQQFDWCLRIHSSEAFSVPVFTDFLCNNSKCRNSERLLIDWKLNSRRLWHFDWCLRILSSKAFSVPVISESLLTKV